MFAEPIRAGRWVACTVVAAGLAGFAPADPPAPPADPADDYATRPVAYIHGNIPVTRRDLGEFLIAHGGADKLDLLVNKMIIDHECKKRGVTVTKAEMDRALAEDVAGLSIKREDFIKAVLPRYGKTLYDWMEDVIKPRLLLTKLCQDRVTVSEADLKVQFEREYGEKRRVQIIMWPKGDNLKSIQDEYAKIRASQPEFDRAARAMANPALAASAGHINPIPRHVYAQDKIVEQRAFELKPGEVSEIVSTTQGYLVMKLHEVIPPNPTVKFEDVKARLQKQAFDERLSQEIPKYFAELKEKAAPNLLFTGPAEWRFEGSKAAAENALKGVSATEPAPAGK